MAQRINYIFRVALYNPPRSYDGDTIGDTESDDKGDEYFEQINGKNPSAGRPNSEIREASTDATENRLDVICLL